MDKEREESLSYVFLGERGDWFAADGIKKITRLWGRGVHRIKSFQSQAGVVTNVAYTGIVKIKKRSGRKRTEEGSNLQPPGPKPGTLSS